MGFAALPIIIFIVKTADVIRMF